jgi:hypothetical protein
MDYDNNNNNSFNANACGYSSTAIQLLRRQYYDDIAVSKTSDIQPVLSRNSCQCDQRKACCGPLPNCRIHCLFAGRIPSCSVEQIPASLAAAGPVDNSQRACKANGKQLAVALMLHQPGRNRGDNECPPQTPKQGEIRASQSGEQQDRRPEPMDCWSDRSTL